MCQCRFISCNKCISCIQVQDIDSGGDHALVGTRVYGNSLYFLFFSRNLFIYFWLCRVFIVARGLSLVAASEGYSSLRCTGLLRWFLLLRSTGSRRVGFSSCSTRARQLWLAGCRAQGQQLWRTGLDAPWHVGYSWTRARTHVPCIGRRTLNHCATKEVPASGFM